MTDIGDSTVTKRQFGEYVMVVLSCVGVVDNMWPFLPGAVCRCWKDFPYGTAVAITPIF